MPSASKHLGPEREILSEAKDDKSVAECIGMYRAIYLPVTTLTIRPGT